MKRVLVIFLLCISTALVFSKEARPVITLDEAIEVTLERLKAVLSEGAIEATLQRLKAALSEKDEIGVAVTFFKTENESLSEHIIKKLEYGIRTIRLSNEKITITELDPSNWKQFEELAGGNTDLEEDIGELIDDNEIDCVISGSLLRKGSTYYEYRIEATTYIGGEWLIEPYTADIQIDSTLTDLLGPAFIDETWKHKLLYMELHIGYGTGYALGGKVNAQVYANSTFGLSLGLGVDYEGFTQNGIHLGGDEKYTDRFVVLSAFPTFSIRPYKKIVAIEPLFEFYVGPFKNMQDIMDDGIASKAWGLLGGVQIGGYIPMLKGSISLYAHSGVYFRDASAGINRVTLNLGIAYKCGLITMKG
jgi:hypothetical protein